MKNERGFSIIPLIISVIIIVAIVVITIKVLFGEDGLLQHYSQLDNEYNKSEVVETLNFIIKEKYFADSKYCQENNKKIEEVYNSDVAIAYLLDKKYIEEYKDVSDNIVPNEYYVKTDSLNSDISSYEVKENGSKGDGTKVYIIKKEDKYNIYFINSNKEEELLGELVLIPEI